MAVPKPTLVAVTLATVVAGVVGVRAADDLPSVAARVIEVQDPDLRAAITRIDRGSPSWREAFTAIATTGRRVVMATPDQVVVQPDHGPLRAFDPADMAEVSAVADRQGQVSAVLVVVNVARLKEMHDRAGSLPGELHADLDRVLAHEVYGHAVPYLLSGHLSARCADPEPRAPATAACAVQRENVIRRELGLGRRTDRGLGSLALARLMRD
jgi:hypothetical protein